MEVVEEINKQETDKDDKVGDDILSQYANFNDESLTSDPLRSYFMQQLLAACSNIVQIMCNCGMRFFS